MTYQTNERTGTGTLTAPSDATWSLLKASDLTGRSIIGSNDETIGTVDDLYIDYDEHTVRYCTVDVGGFLGIGSKTVLVPFEKLQWSGSDLFLPVERETLENAPEFDPNSEYDRSYEEGVIGAWGMARYWSAPSYGAEHSHWREGYDRPEMRHDRRGL